MTVFVLSILVIVANAAIAIWRLSDGSAWGLCNLAAAMILTAMTTNHYLRMRP